MSKRQNQYLALLALVIGAGLIMFVNRKTLQQDISNRMNGTTPLYSQKALDLLQKKTASSVDLSHLGSGLIPPTNMWLSGLALQKNPEPVHPMPLSFKPSDKGFEAGLPSVSSTPTLISGSHKPGIDTDLGSTSYKLSRYDKLSATLTYYHDSQDIGSLTIAEGSPFVFYRAKQASQIKLTGINPSDVAEVNDHYIRYQRDGQVYAVFSKNAAIGKSSSGYALSANQGDLVTFYALPTDNDILRDYADNDVESVGLSYAESGSNQQTSFKYKTSNNQPTVFASMSYSPAAGQSIGSYSSIYGPMKTFKGNSFTISAPTIKPSNHLDLTKLSDPQKQQLASTLSADISATKIDKSDSYFAGKQLARAADLLDVAGQLRQAESVNKLKAILRQGFAERFGDDYFYYETTLKGVAAKQAAFGSEDFNDHHFHYGYWLYAGSIMAKYDDTFTADYQDDLNLLAADIANYQPDENFPEQRNYDPYAGHSWASGLSPFADGNNQESSSEAIHAWNGVSLWGKVTSNKTLEKTGLWMLANESKTAKDAWRSVDTSSGSLKNYTSPVASLSFGGKRTYGTFFSDEASAKLGIQLIPMDPSMVSFADTNSKQKVAASISNDNYNVALGDYVLMYQAISDPAKATSLLAKQTNIDDGNSKTYLTAWIMSLGAAKD